MLAHNVYFTLHDNSAAAKEKLVAACKKYLTGHPGTEAERPPQVRPTDFETIPSPLHVHYPTNIGLHRQGPTHPVHMPYGASLSLETLP